MATINVAEIQKLRQTTGAGMMAAKAALEEAQGNFDKAVELLRIKGLATAAKKADRVASAGLVESYVHGGRIGVLVEVNCETDFVARTDDFKDFVHDLAMHVAAASPIYLNQELVPAAVVDKERSIYRSEVEANGKSAAVVDKIIDGKIDKFYQGVCLDRQPFVKDPAQSVDDLLKALIAKLGENIVIARFCRYELGEGR